MKIVYMLTLTFLLSYDKKSQTNLRNIGLIEGVRVMA